MIFCCNIKQCNLFRIDKTLHSNSYKVSFSVNSLEWASVAFPTNSCPKNLLLLLVIDSALADLKLSPTGKKGRLKSETARFEIDSAAMLDSRVYIVSRYLIYDNYCVPHFSAAALLSCRTSQLPHFSATALLRVSGNADGGVWKTQIANSE